jgi:3-oxoacyl-[acyl-carrier-protein] synthase III
VSPDVHLVGVGTALPGPAVDNAALARRFGVAGLDQWADAFVGTRSRHFCVDLETGAVRSTLADLAVSAARRALEGARLEAGAVDVMVLGTSSPDLLMPATVNVVADHLGINQIPTYQLQSGCTGAVQALDLAATLLRAGKHRTALVLGGDVCTKHFDLRRDPAGLTPDDLVPGLMFGDGAGAAVLDVRPSPTGAVLRHTLVRLTGTGRVSGHTVDWLGPADRDREGTLVSEDYKAIEQLVPGMAREILDELLAELDWKDVDYLLPPQLSGRMTRRIVEHLGLLDALEVSVVAETGNTGNALPFFQLERLLPRLTGHDRAVAVAVESSKWIKGGLALEKLP